MTHMRYWAMSLVTAVCGGFIAIERFAFDPATAKWIAFSLAIAATTLSLGAMLVALLRENHVFSGLSALNAMVAAWTIMAVLIFSRPTGLWLAFAGGLALLLISLRALALHETTVERVVHQLEPATEAWTGTAGGSGHRIRAIAGSPAARRLEVSASMRSWMYWLTNVSLAIAGAFVVLMTFALTTPGAHHASPRWIALGIGIAATCVALGSLLERALFGDARRSDDGGLTGRGPALAVATASAAAPIALIVTMVIYSGNTARWIAFALGCAMVGLSLIASMIHELTSERVRHELEIATPAPAAEPRTTKPAA